MKKTFITYLQLILLIPALLAGLLLPPMNVQASEGKTQESISPVARKRVYLVRPGECLSTIALEMYGNRDYWMQIYEHNKNLIGENPDYLQAGVYLELPEAPERGLEWKTLYEQKPEEYEFTFYDAYISEDAPYEIEECYYYRNTQDEKYGKWEQEAGRYNVCYPRLISTKGRNMEDVNETIRQYAMLFVEEYYVDPDGTTEQKISGSDFRGEFYLRSTARYRITYLDENLLSIVFEHYCNDGKLMQLLKESHRLEGLTIDLETGHVYTCDEIFQDTQGLAVKEYMRVLQKYDYNPENSTYNFFETYVNPDLMADTLNTEGWKDNMWKTSVFLDGEEVHLAFHYNAYNEAQRYEEENWGLWKDYEITDFTAEEIREYQSDSDLWQKWNNAVGS